MTQAARGIHKVSFIEFLGDIFSFSFCVALTYIVYVDLYEHFSKNPQYPFEDLKKKKRKQESNPFYTF